MIGLTMSFKSQSTRGSRIFGNGQKQPHLKLCLLKASHGQVIKSTLFCDRQFKFDPLGAILAQKILQILPNCMSLVKTNMSQSLIK